MKMITRKKFFGGVIIEPGCSLSCIFCGGHSKPTPFNLKKQEVNIYKNLQDFKRVGIKRIAISGSDPIEYDKIIELIRYCKQEGFEFVKLATHGRRLSDPSFLKKLISSGVNGLKMPIYGPNAKIHDSVTQTKGSFNELISGIKGLLKNKTQIQIELTCMILKQNSDDLLNIVDFVSKLNVKKLYFLNPCLIEKECLPHYIPFKNLGIYVKKLYDHVLSINDKIMFLEIPFCVFGKFNTKNINNKSYPPDLDRYNQPAERTKIKDLPAYRLKKKIAICKTCKAFNDCDGFFVNDIDRFGIGKLRPIK